MREIDCEQIILAVKNLCINANCFLPADVRRALETARETEQSEVGRAILGDLSENYRLADAEHLPICQDTGMAVLFVELGQEVHITGGLLEDALNEGVRRGYVDGLLRLSVVADPIRRGNTDDNTPAVIHLRLVKGDQLKITVAPKGFGSENMSVLKMFKPAATVEEIEDFIVSAVDRAGSNPCPPIVLGVGLGGTSEQVMELAKRALLRPVGQPHADAFYADMEQRLLEKINRLGIGPQGLGGVTTALAVHIETAPTHIAGLPCGLNMSCHVLRHAEATL
ncbi:MAG: fumarate hydratase [Clostridiales bacterium]|nr:fumarate hydratase [bacterium 210917-SL.2.15]MCI5843955.1 fumarate hydratase [Clostridiales bacterium]MDY4036306.1 fumarate hydratase [Candidatus Pseudoscilispira sp.]